MEKLGNTIKLAALVILTSVISCNKDEQVTGTLELVSDRILVSDAGTPVEVQVDANMEWRLEYDTDNGWMSTDLMGGKAIRIDLGTSSVPADDGDFLQPSVSPDMLSSIAAGIEPIISKGSEVLDDLDSALVNLNLTLSDENRATLRMNERFCGELVMPHDENGNNRCIACGLCQMACPNDSIRVVSETLTTEDGKKKKVLARYEKLNLAPYKGFINPVYTPVYDKDGKMTDVTVSYTEGYAEQHLRYSKEFATLPTYN